MHHVRVCIYESERVREREREGNTGGMELQSCAFSRTEGAAAYGRFGLKKTEIKGLSANDEETIRKNQEKKKLL